ncbi:MAG: alpha/beta hydrolase [Actinomycetia bacterium]|nr:alpha/beta hydrolase [Actinomycetes bacterium]
MTEGVDKHILIRQRRIRYEVVGTGPAMLCLHGLNQRRDIFRTNRMQAALVGYQQILIDLPGYGESDFLDGCSVEDIAEIIETIRREEGLASLSLCGYCLGSVFALDYAIRHPGHIDSLILMECMIYMPLIIRLITVPLFKVLHDFFFGQAVKFGPLVGLLNWLHIFSPQQLRTFNRVWNREVNNYYLRMLRRYEKLDHLKRAEAVRSKVVIVVAEKTYRKVLVTAKCLEQALRDSVILRLKGTGHLIYLDA